jgi:hypothetical protein
MADIICNRIRTPDGTIIESKNRHDYASHKDANGHTYSVDGGKDYLKRSYSQDAPPAEELSVYSDDEHSVIREVMSWGTYGKEGKDPFHYVALKDMTSEHILACLKNVPNMHPSYRDSFKKELEFRLDLTEIDITFN